MRIFFTQLCLLIGLIGFFNPIHSIAHPILPEAVMEFIWQNPRATDAQIDDWLQANPEHDTYDTREMMTMFRDVTDEQLTELLGEEPNTTEQTSVFANFLAFIWQGVLHILKGPDHVLFVLSLLLIPLTTWGVIKLLSTFTIAHTITLVLAGLGIIVVPSNIVEPIIALSIVVTAAGALLYHYYGTKRFLQHRHGIVFLFGLFHGLGFASVFSDLGIQSGNVVLPLLGFNIGVEFGQLVIVGAIMPAVVTMNLWKSKRLVFSIASVGMIIAASYWFIERIL